MILEKKLENKNSGFGENFKNNINHCFKNKENIISDNIYYYYHSIGVIDFVVYYNEDNKNIQIVLKNEYNSIYHFDNHSAGICIYSIGEPVKYNVSFLEVVDRNDKLYTNLDVGSELFDSLFNKSKLKFRTNEEDHFYNIFKSFSGLSILDNEHISYSKYDKAFLEIDCSFEKTILALLLASNEYYTDIEDYVLWENFLFKRQQIHYCTFIKFNSIEVENFLNKKIDEKYYDLLNLINECKNNTYSLCYDINPIYEKNRIIAVNLLNEKLSLNKTENLLSSVAEINIDNISLPHDILNSLQPYLHLNLNSFLLIDSQEKFNFYEIGSEDYKDLKFIKYFNLQDIQFNFKYKNKDYFDYIENMNKIYFEKDIVDNEILEIKNQYKKLFFIYQNFYINYIHNLQNEKKGIFFKFSLSKYKNLIKNIISNLNSFKK